MVDPNLRRLRLCREKKKEEERRNNREKYDGEGKKERQDENIMPVSATQVGHIK